jgi:hypothetical protein
VEQVVEISVRYLATAIRVEWIVSVLEEWAPSGIG